MRTSSTYALAIALVAGSFVLPGCSDTPAEQKAETEKKLDKIEDKMADSKMADTPKEWEKERADILEDLRDLRNDIDQELNKTNVDLADKDIKPSVRKDKEALKAELEREKANLDAMVAKAEASTDATWTTVKMDLDKAANDTKSWWAREKEKIDKKTKADNDNDGH
jgi:hypothetical protein